jgi:hypothetical protein
VHKCRNCHFRSKNHVLLRRQSGGFLRSTAKPSSFSLPAAVRRCKIDFRLRTLGLHVKRSIPKPSFPIALNMIPSNFMLGGAMGIVLTIIIPSIKTRYTDVFKRRRALSFLQDSVSGLPGPISTYLTLDTQIYLIYTCTCTFPSSPGPKTQGSAQNNFLKKLSTTFNSHPPLI